MDTIDRPHALENIPPDEEQAIRDLVELQRRLMTQSSPVRRGQHAKSHGCLKAEFNVHDDVPQDLRIGVFGERRSYSAWVRFSNGFSSDDRNPDVHGIGIKLTGVAGRKILPHERSADTQDFLLADHPVFFAPTVRKAVDFFGTKVQFDQQGVPPEEAFQQLAEKYPVVTPLFLNFVRRADPSPLETQYWSETPSLLGSRAVKYLVRPLAENTNRASPSEDSPDCLRQAMVAHLTTDQRAAAFEFCAQIQGVPDKMPVEDPTVEWDAPWIAVATLSIGPQEFDTEDREEFGEFLSLSPWHSLPQHRPLGGINRARRHVYEMSSRLRHEFAGKREFEPGTADDAG